MNSKNREQEDHLSKLRRYEFEKVKHFFNSNDKVLEIGGGSGFQASLISKHVDEIVSIDVYSHPIPVAEVKVYDGINIPFPDKYFNAVFSSNALEHIQDIDGIMLELKRVLKDNGVSVHIVPTVSWRIFTSLAHYPGIPRLLWSNYQNLKTKITLSAVSQAPTPEPRDETKPSSLGLINIQWILNIFTHFKLKWIKSILLSPRHGERGNALTEAWFYRSKWWQSVFKKNGMVIKDEFPLGLFYTGNTVLGRVLSLSSRRILSKLFGSSTRIFFLKNKRRCSSVSDN